MRKQGWTYKKLGEVCKIARGGSPRPIKNYITTSSDGLNWIKIGDTDPQGKYIFSTKEKIRKEGLKKTRWVEENEFLLSNSMSFGRPYILKTNGCIHDGWLVLRDYQDSLFIDFFYYLLISPFVQKQFKIKAQGSTVSNLNTDRVTNIDITFPSLEEQGRIVARLDAAFAQIDELRANAEKQLEEARALFNAALNEEMKPKKGWEEKTLKDISIIAGDYGLSVPSKPYDGIRYLRITDITEFGELNNNLVSADVKEKKQEILKEGDILFARTGATVGKTLIYKNSFGKCLFAGYLIRYRLDKSIILPQFMHYVTHSKDYFEWVSINQKAAAQPNINAKKYNSFLVAYPSLSEQEAIVERLDVLSERVKELEEIARTTVKECDALKLSILRETFE